MFQKMKSPTSCLFCLRLRKPRWAPNTRHAPQDKRQEVALVSDLEAEGVSDRSVPTLKLPPPPALIEGLLRVALFNLGIIIA